MRYDFQIDPLMKWILLPFSATPENCFAEIESETLHVKMGKLFDEVLPLSHMKQAESSQWPFYLGLGARLGLNGEYGVLASTKNVVAIDFQDHEYIKALGPMHFKAQKLVLSLEEPEAFMRALNEKLSA